MTEPKPGDVATSPPLTAPSRTNRIGAALVVVLLLASLARSVVRPTRPPAPADPSPIASAAAPPPADADRPDRKTAATRSGPLLRFEFQAEVPAKESGPPLRLRLRPRDGAQRPFDFTTRDEPTRTRFALPVVLPVEAPELPLRVAIVGESWCIPPGLVEFEVARLDQPCLLVLARARRVECAVVGEENQPLAAVRIVDAAGRLLGTTAADGHVRLVLPARAQRDALVALAEGFAPTLVAADGKPVVLRRAAAMGQLHGVVRAADGTPVAGATVEPRWFPGGEAPNEANAPAATPAGVARRGLWRLAEWTNAHPTPAVAATSGADGAFTLLLPFGGRLILTASRRDFGKTSLTLDLADDAARAGARTEAEIRFERRVALTVAVTRDGAPASRCVVEVVHPDPVDPTLLAAATCDAKGRAVLSFPDLAPLFVVARADDAAPRVVDFDAKGEANAAIGVELERGRGLKFRLMASDGTASDGTAGDALEPAAQIVEARDAASHALLATATSDARGAVRFARLPTARGLDLLLPQLGAAAPPLRRALELELERDAAAAGDVDLGPLRMKRE